MKRRYAYLTPFSHTVGAACLIPTTSYVVQAFASKLLIYDIEDRERKLIKEHFFDVKGVLQHFTLLQDLERGCVGCFSDLFRVYVTPTLEVLPKNRTEGLKGERLCLGAYKKQEIERLRKSPSLTELFPLLFRLGNQVQVARTEEKGSVFTLLEQCRSLQRPEQIDEAFRALFYAGFSAFFLPKQEDNEWHNLYKVEEIEVPILTLLLETAFWIRSLFFLSGENFLHFLPQLPPQCVFGKMFDIESRWGKVDFEWSKKEMYKIRLCCEKGGLLEIRVPSSIKSYRLTYDQKERRVENKTIVEVKAGNNYFFDRFEK